MSLEDYIIEKGGHIQTRTRVTKISVENGQAIGVELENGRTIRSKYVISASDMKRTFLDLVEPQALNTDFRDRIEKAEIGESAVCVFLGTDIPAEKLPVQGCPHFYVHPDYEGIEAMDRMKDDFLLTYSGRNVYPCFE